MKEECSVTRYGMIRDLAMLIVGMLFVIELYLNGGPYKALFPHNIIGLAGYSLIALVFSVCRRGLVYWIDVKLVNFSEWQYNRTIGNDKSGCSFLD